MYDEGYTAVIAWSSDPDFSGDEDGVIEEPKRAVQYGKITFGIDEPLNIGSPDQAWCSLHRVKTCREWFWEHRHEKINNNFDKPYLYRAEGGSYFRAKTLWRCGIISGLLESSHIDVENLCSVLRSHEKTLEKLIAWTDEMHKIYGDDVFFQIQTW